MTLAPILLAGTIIVNLALIFYSIGVITEQRRHRVTGTVIRFLVLGVIFDVTATVFMIIGSPNSPFSLHGLLGYSSLTAMLIDTFLAWRHRSAHGEAEVGRGLHLYSRIAYIWWIAAYITGALLVMARR
jgi:hypothetical protein